MTTKPKTSNKKSEMDNLDKFESDSMKFELMIKRENLKQKYGFDITIADYINELKILVKNELRIGIFLTLMKGFVEKTHYSFTSILNMLQNSVNSNKLSYHLTFLVQSNIIEKHEVYSTEPIKKFYKFYRLTEKSEHLAFLLYEYLELFPDNRLLERPDMLFELAVNTSELIIKEKNTYWNVAMISFTDVHKSFLEMKTQRDISEVLRKQKQKQK